MKTLQARIESDTTVNDIVYNSVIEPERVEPSFTGSNYLKVLVRRVMADGWFDTISFMKTSKPEKFTFGKQELEGITGKLTAPDKKSHPSISDKWLFE